MFQHRIENRQQLPHTGGECHLLGFPCSLQALIEDTEPRTGSLLDFTPRRAL
jgi:hypothetical protein